MKRLKILFSFTWVVCMGIDLLYSQCDASFDISSTSVCAQQSVTFTGTNNGSNQSFEWEFSGIGIRTGRRVELSFPARDNAYDVEITLTVRDEDGNECSSTQVINIQATPRIEGELINTQRCLDAASPIDTFSTGVRITSAIPSELTWNWGDGSGSFSSDQEALGHTYNQYGSFPVEVSFDNGQCIGYYRDTVRFYKRPSVDIQLPVGGTDLCEGEKVNVVNTTDSSVVDYYVWNWGDGNTDIVYNNSTPDFTYNLSGGGNCAENSEEYTIEVRAFNSCIDKNTHRGTIDIFVSPTVVAEIGINDTVRCVGESISFSNLTCPKDDRLEFEWDFGDGSTSTEKKPSHTYTSPGIYEVKLRAVNAGEINNCGAVDAFQTVIITDIPQVAVNFTGEGISGNNEGCAPFELVIDNQTTPDAGVDFTWTIDTTVGFEYVNETNRFSRNPEITFNQRGNYLVSLEARNECGIGDPWEQEFIIGSSPRVELAPIPDTCGDFTATFSANIDGQGGNITQIDWDFPGGTPATFTGENPPAITYAPAIEPYQVTVSAENECGIQSATGSFSVSGLAALEISSDTTICSNEGEIALSAIPSGGIWVGDFVDPGTGIFNPPVDAEGDFVLSYTVGTGACQVEDLLTITVSAPPQITIIPEIDALCEGDDPIVISAIPEEGIWEGGAITDTTFNPITAGMNILRYTYIDPNTGCENTSTKEIDVQPKPTISITDQTYCRTESDIILSGFSPGLNDGGEGLWQGPGIVNERGGSFNSSGITVDSVLLTYIFTTTAGCVDSSNMQLTLVESEVAEAGDNDTLCRNDEILLLEGFSPVAGSWEGSGIIPGSNQFNPLIADLGANVVTYTIGSEECETQDTKVVFVQDTASVSAGEDLIVCEGDGIVMLEASEEGGIWEGPGIIDPETGTFEIDSIQTGTDAVFNYTLTTPEGCSSSATQIVQKSALPEIDFSQDSSVCINAEVVFENSSLANAEYFWDFGDSTTSTDQSPSHVYTAAGTYIIRLNVESTTTGCSDSMTNTIKVVDVPNVSFLVDKNEGCAIKLNDSLSALPVTITDQSQANGGSYVWELGTGEILETSNPGQLFFPQGPSDTTYAIRLTLDNGCDISTQVDSVTVFPLPQVRIGLPQDEGCSPFRVDSIFNLSQGNPETYFWDLGNGNTSSEIEPPSQVYRTGEEDSVYDIALLSSNNCGVDTGQIQLVVYPQNVFAGFAVDTIRGCQPLEVSFEDFSGAPYTIWDFGDGTRGDSAKNPIHIYDQAGTFNVEFIAHNQCSYDTTSRSITVLPNAPSSALVNTPVCLNETMTFFAIQSEGIAGYQWAFGDGNIDASPNVSHIYDSPGTFTVTLTTLSDTFLCPSTWDTMVTVTALPGISINIPEDQGCQPFTAIFDNQSEGQFYQWDFGDGGSANDYAPTNTYHEDGNYRVNFITENRQGCKSDTSFTIRVFETPVSQFSIVDNILCEGESAIFNNQSTGSGLNFLWSLGNGDSLRTANPIYQYTESGTYNISLTASNAFGCQDVSTSDLTVYLQPRADFDIPPLLCTDKAISFQVLDSIATNWFWDFGDGATSNTINPVHVYDVPGIYTIRHIANYQSFCFDTVFKELELFQSPEVDFVFEFNDKPDGTVFFEDTSPLPGDSFQWDFGDNANGTGANLSHQYSYADSFSVTLISSFQSGCTDTLTRILIPRYGDIQIPNAFAPTGGSSAGDARFFKPKVAGLKEFYITIYSQWGNKIWESEDELDEVTGELLADAYWDGTDENGKLIRSNAFVWKIHKAIFIDGREYRGEKVGVLHLIR